MPERPASRTNSMLVAVLVGVVVAGGMAFLWRIDWWGERGSGLSPRFEYDLAKYTKVDPALIGFDQAARVPLELIEPRAVAVGPEDRIYVAGDQAVAVFAPSGDKIAQFALAEPPQCLAVGQAEHAFPGRVYVGLRDRVEVYSPEGKRLARWEDLGPKAVLTSIALAEQEVYVANAGGKAVLRYDVQGKLLGQIDAKEPDRRVRGFIVPSPYFDVALAPDGLLRVVNPGLHQVEAYTTDGHLEQSWGQAGLGIEAFCGCCNPANIALLGDGSVITAEKGIPRVKLYTAEGKFECVVAGPETLGLSASSLDETRTDHKLKVLDVAADSHGRILVLDPSDRAVRVFVRRNKTMSDER